MSVLDSGAAWDESPDLDMAARFLAALDPAAKEFTFQTFDDSADRKDAKMIRILHGSLASLGGILSQLNRKGAGVYLTVNRTNLKGRKLSDIVGVRAVWQEDDDGWQGALPLDPSIVVSSSPGKYHRYWLASGIQVPEHRPIMERLVREFGCDKNAKDAARVLRVPGFYHKKREPHLVRLLDANARVYTAEEIKGAFPPWVEIRKSEPTYVNITPDQQQQFERLREALRFISPDGYDEWLRVGAALRHEFGAAGRAIWDQWASGSNKFSMTEQDAKWQKIDAMEKIGLGTIFHMAELGGYRPAIAARERLDARPPLAVIDGGRPDQGAPPQPSIAGFRPFFAGEGSLAKPPMFIKGLLRERGVVLIGGQSQAGKSYVAIALALALATGGSFFGRPVKEQVGVIYAAAEGDDTIQPRLVAAQKAAGIKDHPPICVFQDFRMPRRGEGVRDTFAPFVANVMSAREVFAERNMPAPRVLFIDTASAGIDMEDENANTIISEVIKRLRELGSRADMLVVVVHHFGKDASKKLRGGSAWFADSDQVLSVLTQQDENGVPINPRSLFLDKLRGFPAGLVGNFDLGSLKIGVDEDGEDSLEGFIQVTGGKPITIAGMATATASPKKQSKAMRVFRDAFSEASHSGRRRQIERGGPQKREVHACELEDVRKEFMRIFVGGKGAARMAWSRAVDEVNSFGLGYSTEVDRDKVEWIWRADEQDAARPVDTHQDLSDIPI
jgi:hypothetical protein